MRSNQHSRTASPAVPRGQSEPLESEPYTRCATLVPYIWQLHDPSVPLFLFWAPHIVHTPLQLPEEYVRRFDFIAPTDKPTHERQVYHAMVNFADAMVANVTKSLQWKGMWEDTLFVFSTDNGGPIYGNGSVSGSRMAWMWVADTGRAFGWRGQLLCGLS